MTDNPAPYPAMPATGAANTPGRIALVLAILATVVALISQVLSVFAPLLQADTGAASGQIAALFAIIGVIHLLLSAAAVAFGVAGVTRRGLGQSAVSAAMGLGAGAVGVIGGLVGFAVIPVITSLL